MVEKLLGSDRDFFLPSRVLRNSNRHYCIDALHKIAVIKNLSKYVINVVVTVARVS